MEKYMGYQIPEEEPVDDGRVLPLFRIEGTDFIVDMQRHLFREKGNPRNQMTLGKVKAEYGFSFFYYDSLVKNRYTGGTAKLPEWVTLIIVPPLKDLDPVGLARRHGLADNYYQNQQVTTDVKQWPQLKLHQPEQPQPAAKRKTKLT